MRAVVQRVQTARVTVETREVGRIGVGLLVLVGIGADDGESDIAYLVTKVRELRVFEDDEGRMNRSVLEAGGALLVVSQFTLYGDCRRGRRPSFEPAARPAEAKVIYERLVSGLRDCGLTVETGKFQAMMKVALVNDGPVTLLLDSARGF